MRNNNSSLGGNQFGYPTDCVEILYSRLLYGCRCFFGVGKAGCSYYDTFFKTSCAHGAPIYHLHYLSMQISCNVQQREVEADMSLASMLDSLSLPADSVVAEINMKIIDRDQYETTRLSDGDQVELIRFVGGG